ncbi:MAG: elongation factor Ts [Patescibacteria group bacterium]
MVDAKQVQKIREMTGLGMMDIRNALEEAGGDEAQAMTLLEQRAGDKLEKRAGRTTSQGRIGNYVHMDNKLAAVVEVQCETDFVANSEDFVTFVKDLAMQIAAMKPETMADLMAQDSLKESGKTVADLHKALIAKTGENIVIKKFGLFQIGLDHNVSILE